MRVNSMRRLAWLAGLLVLLSMVVLVFSKSRNAALEPLPADQIELTKVVDGTTYALTKDGRLFRVNEATGKWYYEQTVLQLDEMQAAYLHENGVVYRYDAESNVRLPVRRNFSESFEGLETGVAGLRQMIGQERGWGALTLQSPKAREVSDYVRLRQRILAEKGDFLDAAIFPDDRHVRTGTRSLFFTSPPKPSNMVTCKASVSSPLVYFEKGDTFCYRASYYAEESLPFTVMDLECEWIKGHAGIRICINENGQIEGELKALDKPRYRQTSSKPVSFPMGRWVQLQTQIQLSNEQDGHIRIWQDGELLVDTDGVTLPMESAIYSSLEIGISAHSYGSKVCKLWVDDIEVSDRPFELQSKTKP